MLFERNKVFWPDYQHSILGISNSILKHYGATPHGPTLAVLDKRLAKNYKNVVFMIFDGMGVDMLKHAMLPFSFLRRQVKDKLSSVFPPTTTAATTGFYSGLEPITHGWLAWAPYFRELGRSVELFTNKDFYFQQPITETKVADKLPYQHIFSQIKKVNPQVMTTEIFPPFKPNGVHSVKEQCDRVVKQCQKDGQQFILTYWNDPDHLSHLYGPYSVEVKEKVSEINNLVKEMCQNLTDTLVIISADHGHVPVKGAVYVDDYADVLECLAAPLSLDDRVSAIFLKSGKEDDFVKLFQQYFSSDFMLLKSDEAVKKGLFGVGKVNPQSVAFLGDYLVISTSYKSFRQRVAGMADFPEMKGAHAGLTQKEMLVPLIVVERK